MAYETTLIIGGTRSGKSSYASKLADEAGKGVIFIATGKAVDDEMRDRIEAHKVKRPNNWRTLEADGDIPSIIDKLENGKEGMFSQKETILIDCISFYVADLMKTHEIKEEEILEHFNIIRKRLMGKRDVVMVSSEVGFGVVPPYPLGRKYRDILGMVNQMLAESANCVMMMVAGIPMMVKNGRDN